MQKGSKVAIVGCSNGQPQTNREKVVLLEKVLVKIGLCPVFSDFLLKGILYLAELGENGQKP